MKICLAGEGAMGGHHIKTLQSIEGVEVVSLAGGIEADAAAFARQWGIPHVSLNLEECLGQPGVEAAVLATPNAIHAAQAALALNMGKHVFVELPMALNLRDSERVVALAEKSGRVYMVDHSQRYGAPYREVYRQVREGVLHLHHVVSQTYFFRRENRNMHGKPRTWTDDLLWHQACHMIDYVCWLLDDPEMAVWGQAGPNHSKLGIPMDLTLGMRSRSGILVSAALSFNNHGPITGAYRFIGEEHTLLIEKKGLTDHEGKPVTPQGVPFHSPIHEFVDSIRQGREPLTSCKACLPTMRLLHRLQQSIDSSRS